MDFFKQELPPDTKVRVLFRQAGVIEGLYHPDDDYPAFCYQVEGFVRVHQEVLVVLQTSQNEVDVLDQSVKMLLIPWSDVIDVKPL